MRLIKLLIALLILWASGPVAMGQSCNGSGLSWDCQAGVTSSTVNAAIAAASDGFVMTFDAGSYTFTAPMPFLLTKGGTMICATPPSGIGAATVNPCTMTVPPFSYDFGIPTWAGTTQERQYFSKFYRISGFTFADWPVSGSPITFGLSPSPVNEGTLSGIRIDHCTFTYSTIQSSTINAIQFTNSGHRTYFYGVLDHNLMTCAGSCHFVFGITGGTDPFNPPNPTGTLNNLFLEDDDLSATSESNPGEGAFDWNGGTQGLVFRHLKIRNNDLTSHYTMSNYEVYNSLFIKDGGSPNPDCYRAVHAQTTALGIFFNNQFTCSSSPHTVVLSMGTIREGYRVDPRFWPRTLKPTGFSCHPPFCDSNRFPSQTNQGYPYFQQPTRDIATGVLAPFYAWNNTANGIFRAVSVEDFGFGQNPDYYNNHLQVNRDIFQATNAAAQTSLWDCTSGAGMAFGPSSFQATNCPVYVGEVGGGFGYAVQNTVGTIGASASGVASDAVLNQFGANGWKVAYYSPAPYPHPYIACTNGTASACPASLPTFSKAPGAYQGTQSLTISCSSPTPTLYITTDGSAPTHANPLTSPQTMATVASGKETINAICSSPGLPDSLTLSGGYYINAQAYSAWPLQPGTYPATPLVVQINNPGQNTRICATDDGSIPSSSGLNDGACGHTHLSCTPSGTCTLNGVNQFANITCPVTCTISFLSTGVNFIDSPITTVKYVLGGSNGLWWEDVGGSNFTIGGVTQVENFGNQQVGITSGTLPIYLNSPTSASQNTVISSVVVAGSGFARANGDMCGATPITIAATGYCNIQLTFTPPSTGVFNGTVTITDNTAGSPHVIPLQGTGVPAGSGSASVTIGIQIGPGHQALLSWIASSTTDVTSYNVYRSTQSGTGFVKIGSVSKPTVQYLDTTVQPGVTYYYVFTSVDVNGESIFSSQISGTIPTP